MKHKCRFSTRNLHENEHPIYFVIIKPSVTVVWQKTAAGLAVHRGSGAAIKLSMLSPREGTYCSSTTPGTWTDGRNTMRWGRKCRSLLAAMHNSGKPFSISANLRCHHDHGSPSCKVREKGLPSQCLAVSDLGEYSKIVCDNPRKILENDIRTGSCENHVGRKTTFF